jgi:ribokinase
MPQRPRVTVLGSLNTDISVAVPHLPGAGETVLGSAAVIGPGGKGANQAVAAARLGAAVRMTGCLGDDDFGRRLAAALAAEGVDASGLRAVAGATSGLALISVDASGENAITVSPGANALAGEQEVEAAFAAACDVLVLSAEIPVSVLAGALARARAAGVTSVLNLAPAPAGAPALLADGVDWLVVNVPEAGAVLGRAVTGPGDAGPAELEIGHAAAELARSGARYAVITLGAAGAVLAAGPDAGGAVTVPGFAVTAVDSVGAGDAFVGALAVALAAGTDPAGAVRAACAAGAAAVTRRGAQAALPCPADVLAVTGLAWPGPPGGGGPGGGAGVAPAPRARP